MTKSAITKLALASLLASQSSAAAQEAEQQPTYIEIKVEGPGELRPETRLALARLLGEDPAADLYYLARNHGQPVEALCGPPGAGVLPLDQPTCLQELQGALAQAIELSGHGALGAGTLRAVPVIATEEHSYALLDKHAVQAWPKSLEDWSHDPTMGACAACSTTGSAPLHWAAGPGEIDLAIGRETVEIVAAPLDRHFLKDKEVQYLESPFDLPENPDKPTLYTISAAASDPSNFDLFPKLLAYADDRDGAAALIEEDLSVLGSSDRFFAIRADLGAEERDEILSTLADEPLLSDVIEVHDSAPTFELIHPTVVFEAAADECGTDYEDWPLPATRIAEIMCFNELVRSHLGLGPPRRSRILIVDSGLGPGLAGDPSFAPGLYTELSELLSSKTVVFDSPDKPRCVDADENGYYGDAYGTSAGITSKSTLCRESHFHLIQLVPPEADKLLQQQYFPGHGGFVGGLALGGSDLSGVFPNITAFVGLTYFRVIRVDKKGIYVDPQDIRSALAYAARIRADVVNLSLKTDDEATFVNIAPELFLITSAGNNSEDFDKPAPNNLPASMAKLEEQMLVVGALQPSESAPWWSKSASSPAKVHIAAPGAQIWSYGLDNKKVCSSGTSAAAPLVSFTAAVLKALGLPTRRSIKGRILASADHDLANLGKKVGEGRKLRVDAALDLFVDRVERSSPEDGSIETLRGWIVPSDGPRISICAPGKSSDNLQGSSGLIDLSLLWTWRRLSEDKGRLFHEHGGVGPYATDECVHPSGSFAVRLISGDEVEVAWADVLSILPTPFRAAQARILELTSELTSGAPQPDPGSTFWCSQALAFQAGMSHPDDSAPGTHALTSP